MALNLYDDALETLDEHGSAAAGNPYEETLKLQDSARETSIRRSVIQGSGLTPERAAESRRLSQRLGLPPAVIERNFDKFKTSTDLEDVTRVGRDAPHLGDWMAADPNNAAVAKDDLPTLSVMERTLGVGRHLVNYAKAGWSEFKEGLYGKIAEIAELTEAVTGATVPPLTERAKYGMTTPGTVNLREQPKVQNPDGTISTVDSVGVNLEGEELLLPTVTPDGRHFTGTEDEVVQQAIAEYQKTGRHLGIFSSPEGASAYAQQLHEEYAAGKYDTPTAAAQIAAAGRAAAAIAGNLAQQQRGSQRGMGFVERAVYGGVESFVQNVPGLVAGFATGPGAALTLAGATTSGQGYIQAREQGLRPEQAATFGAIQGAIEVATEFVPAHWFFKDVGAKAPLIKLIAHQIASEIPGEEIATVLQDLNEWATLPANKDRPFTDYLEERPSAAAATAISTIVAIGASTIPTHATARVFEQMGQAAQESKTVQRSPEAAQAFIEQATRDGPVSHVYAPIDTFTSYWQSKGVDPNVIATELTGDPEAYRTAVETGEDLVIPTAAYAVKLAGTEHNAYFAQELRLAPDQMNAREAQAFEAQIATEQAAAAPEAAPAAAVRANVLAQLEAAGVPRATAESYATLYESAFGALAERAGVTPSELFTRYGLQVTREGLPPTEGAPVAPGVPAAVPTPTVPQTPEARIQALEAELVREREERRSVERSVEVDPLTGLGNRRALDKAIAAAEADPNTSVIFFDANNFGMVNKALGSHKAGDAVLVRIAQAIQQAATEAGVGERAFRRAEGGDEFVVLAPSAKADQIRARAEELFGAEDYVHPEKGAFQVSLAGSVGPTMETAEAPLQQAKAARKTALIESARQRAPNYAPSRIDTTRATAETTPDVLTAEGLPAAAIAAGEELPSAARERGTPGAVGPIEGRGAGAGVEPGGLPAAGRELRGLPELDETFERRPVEENQARLTPDVTRELERIRDELSTFPFVERTWNWITTGPKTGTAAGGAADIVAGAAGASVYHDVLAFSPVNKFRGQPARKARGTRGDVLGAITQVLANRDIHNNLAEGAVRVAEHRNAGDWSLLSFDLTTLPPTWGTPAPRELTDRLAADLDTALSETVEPAGEGDVSFDVTEFEQGPKPTIDVLETGEEQQRLPGDVGEVREQEIATPELEAPFSLTSETASRKVQQTKLFQALQRGAIRFGADRQVAIEFFAQADLSTFLHESGHFYLEVLRDLANQVADLPADVRTDTQQQMLADLATLQTWFADEEHAGAGFSVKQHEQFARGFEAYLMEGKAPNAELRSVFARFRAWLLGIYRSFRSLNVQLTPEVRHVFDRMLATDAAIEAAQQDAQQRPLWLTPETAGMTPAQFERYREQLTESSRKAREQLEQQILAEVRRTQTEQWKSQRATIEAEVTGQIQQQPVYRALAAMRTGTEPDGSPLAGIKNIPEQGEPLKLSKDLIVAEYGAERLKALPRPYIYTREGGLHPDTVAQLYGFSSGDQLLTAVSQAPKMETVIQQETDRRMLAEHGSLLLDGTLPEKAQAAVANEAREEVIVAELKALNKLRRGGPARIRAALPRAQQVRTFARERIARTNLREIRPQVFWAAARRASTQAVELAAKQDIDGTIAAKQQELVNLALYREAQRANEDIESRVQRARELSTGPARQRLGLAGESYLDQVDGILDRYEFARVSQKALDRRASLRKWVAAQEGEGLPIDLPEDLLEETRRTNYRELTYETFVGVTDGLQQIAHLARLKNRLLKAAEQRELSATAAMVSSSIRDNARQPRRQGARDRRVAEERTRMVEHLFAGHRKLASMLREMDGFEDGGPAWDAIMRPLNDAGAREAEMNATATRALAELVETAYPKAEKRSLYTKTFVPAINDSLSKMERLMVALNWGNEGNRQRVRDGWHWSDQQVAAVLETLDERDWKFVQGTWDLIDGYWGEIAAKQRRVFGVAPEKVAAVPIQTRFGEQRGGYFPLKYDDRLSATPIQMLDLESANLAKQAAYTQSTTRRGHTEARQTRVELPLRRDFGVIFEHVQQVIHDLSHHETLIDVNRVLGHRDVQQAIMDTYGDLVYKQIRGTIRDVAFGTVPATTGFEKVINHVRTGATIAGIGWNLTTAFLQPIGLTNSAVRIGPQWVARGLYRWLRSPTQMVETVGWISEKSPMMRLRGQTMQREIAEVRQQVGVTTGRLSGWVDAAISKTTFDTVSRQAVADSYFYLIQQMQRVADVPTWLGQYEKSMAAGEPEDRAIALADQAVLDSQGGGQTKDLSQVQRGGPMMKLWTNFYSFFNVLYQQSTESYRRTKFSEPMQVARLAGDYLMLFIVPATLGYLVRQAMRPGDPEDEDALAWSLLTENLSYLAGTMLGLREISGTLQGYYGYEGPAGARFFAALGRFGQQVKQGELDTALIKAFNDTAGILLHYPAGQVRRTLDGIAALAEGKTANPMAIITGPPPKTGTR